MTIANDDDLNAAVQDAGALLQGIQDYLGRRSPPSARVRFPRGFLRTVAENRKRLSFVRKGDLRSNLCYSILLSDVYFWLLRRTDLAGTAQDMVVKAGLVLAGSIAEGLLLDFYAGVLGKRQKFTTRTSRLLTDGIISAELQADLDWLWRMRCRLHLYELDDWEFDTYSVTDYNRAAKSITNLITALQAASGT